MAKINTVFALTDNVSNPLRMIQNNLSNTVKGFESLSGKIVAVNSLLNIFSYGMDLVQKSTSFFQSFISDASEYESLMVRLKVATGDASTAMKEFEELKDFASKTPFDLPGVVDASIMFRNAGIEAENIIPTIKMLGDVAQGNNEYFNRMALNFMQIKSAGKATMQDLNQFAYMGIPIKQVLKDMGREGDTSFEAIQMAFKRMTSEGGQFYNSMNANAGTMSGSMSNLRDSIQQVRAELGDQLLPVISSVIRAISEMLSELKETQIFQNIKNKFTELANTIKYNLDSIIATIIKVGTIITEVGIVFATAWSIINYPITLTVLGVTLFIKILYEATKVSNDFSVQATGGFNQVAESASSLGAIIGGVVGTIQGLFNILYNAVATLINAFASLAEFFVNVWFHPIKTIKNFFLDLLSTILDVVSTVAGVFDLFGTGLSKTLNDASEKLRELKSTEGMYSYGRLELQDVNGIPQAINSGANSAYSAGALVDKYLSQVAGLNSEISDKLSEGIKTDGNGNIKVNDEKNLEMSKEYNKLLQQRATELFKIQYSTVVPQVIIDEMKVSKEVDSDKVAEVIIDKMTDMAQSSLGLV